MNKTLLEGTVKAGGFLLFCAGLFFVTQAYTMAFHGIYVDCFAQNVTGCALRAYSEPSLISVLYGTALALGALVTFYLGARAIRWTQKPAA